MTDTSTILEANNTLRHLVELDELNRSSTPKPQRATQAHKRKKHNSSSENTSLSDPNQETDLTEYFERLVNDLAKNQNGSIGLKLTELMRKHEPTFARATHPTWGVTTTDKVETNKGTQTDTTSVQRKPSYSEVVNQNIQKANNSQTTKTNKVMSSEHNTNPVSVTFQERLDMSANAENTWRQLQSNMNITDKARVRTSWLREMNAEGTITTWSSGEEPLPLYARTDEKLLDEIAGYRMECCLNIQEAVAHHLESKTGEYEKDTAILLRSLDDMLDDNPNCTFDQAKNQLALLVGKETASLKQQLLKKKDFFSTKCQHSRKEFANAKFVFPSESQTKGSNPKNPSSTTDPQQEGNVDDEGNKTPKTNQSKKKVNKGQNGPKKDFQPPRQGKDTNVHSPDGGWKTASRKRERSKSRDGKPQNKNQRAGNQTQSRPFQQTQGWTLSAREKELIKAFRKP